MLLPGDKETIRWVAKMMIDRKEIEDGIKKCGLFAFISTLPPQTYCDNDTISAIASVLSTQAQLISNDDKAYLKGIENSKFFYIQRILCKVIPIVDTKASTLMDLVHYLVERSGHDYAANLPSSAFLKWCKSDVSRADQVIELARSGDVTACKHLSFALEAKEDVNEAISCLEGSLQEQIAGAVALSQMQPDEAQSLVALDKIIFLAKASDTRTAYQFTRAAYDISTKHQQMDRIKLHKLLCEIFIPGDEWIIYLMASLLNHHHMEMIESELDFCLKKIAKFDPSNKGTIKMIDQSMVSLLNNGKIHKVSSTVYKIIEDSDGKIGISALKNFFRKLTHEHPSSLAKLTTDWLQRGGFYPCSVLSKLISKLPETKPIIDVHEIPLPASTQAQIFLCRRAIGYLFFHPMTAAAFSLAVIDRGQPDAKASACELLYDPLLLSYGGPLPNWLRSVSMENENCRQSIDDVLKRAAEVWDDFKLALEVVELEPSKNKRDVVAFQEIEEAEYIQDEAHKRSIFASIIKNEYLLYGDETAVLEVEDSGSIGYKPVPYTTNEIRSEIPKGIFLDPVGLEMMLDRFRGKQIP